VNRVISATDTREPDGRRGRAGAPAEPGRHSGSVPDLCAVAAAGLLLAAAALVGRSYPHAVTKLSLNWPPLYAYWRPHWGPGTPAAVLLAAAGVAYGPQLARRLSWRLLLPACWAAAMAWTWSLALVDGWRRGVAHRLETKYEYLQSVGGPHGIHDIAATLRGFTGHILMHSPDNWPSHVAGHPPGAVLTFVLLDRVGLGGGGWAAAFVITAGSSAAAAVLVAVRALASEEAARRAAPFAALAPSAVWTGVSADGWFTAVGGWAVALLALAASESTRAPRTVAVCSGLAFGLVCYLSYGLVLLGLLALAVLIAARTVRPVPYVLAGMAPWFAVFTGAGFWWFDGYTTLVRRYYEGAAAERPYGYFVWANLAAQTVVWGPALAASLRRAAVGGGAGGPADGARLPRRGAVLLLAAGAVAAVLLADVSGMSKAETERIWLPFTLWLLPATALLPERARRGWLAAHAGLALVMNHLFLTGW